MLGGVEPYDVAERRIFIAVELKLQGKKKYSRGKKVILAFQIFCIKHP